MTDAAPREITEEEYIQSVKIIDWGCAIYVPGDDLTAETAYGSAVGGASSDVLQVFLPVAKGTELYRLGRALS